MNIGVYGLGRFGSLWASLLSAEHTVKAYNRSHKLKIPPGVMRVEKKELFDCEILFLCVSISSMEEVLLSIRDDIKENTIIADTCSVKVYPTKLMEQLLPANVPILGTHPMFGPDSAQYGVKGLPIVTTPVRLSDDEYRRCLTIFERLGLRIIELSADQHDEQAAYTQGVTHFIGRVLEDLSLKETTIGTVGFNKLLEIIDQTCNDPWQLFIDLQRLNPYTKQMRKSLNKSLDKIMKKLET
jgi:prephenate dehydrogenase